MTVSIGRIVHVEYPGVFDGVKPGIVTAVWHSNIVDVTVFGVGNARGHGTREYTGVKFYHERPEADLQYATAYYPPRVQEAPKPEEHRGE